MITKGDKINDRYQIIKTIGEGGMANVYLANDLILNRQVAVKILRGDLSDDEKFVRRFQREALSASKLTHPNIVEMYDVGEDNGNYYIVMEYVNGKTLKNLIKRRGALTLPEVVDIMTQLTSAVSCAHDSFIIHRDIKPQNVLILEDGTVKITDFGIAMALNSNELTQTNSVMGSVHYLPPEQATGTGSTIKSDIYSLGILMYELLTGKIPFKGENAVEIAIKQMKDPIPSVCASKPDIPQSIENIVLKACAKNPKNRYETVKFMSEEIKKALTDEGLKEKKLIYKYFEHEAEEEKVTKPVKKKKGFKNKLLWVTGIVFALLVTLICIIIIVYPMLTEVPDVVVPDVSSLGVTEAETILKENGLTVASEVDEKKSDEIEPGKVIGTSPQVGRTIKEGTEVTIIVAVDSGNVLVENYVGSDYKTIEANLTNAGLNVLIESKKITKDDQDNYKENTIVDQSAKEGETLEPGDTIVLYYASFVDEYPNFADGYTIDDVHEFADKHSINISIKYVVNDSYEEGTIIAQNRTGEVIAGSTLTITVTQQTKEEVEEPTE